MSLDGGKVRNWKQLT